MKRNVYFSVQQRLNSKGVLFIESDLDSEGRLSPTGMHHKLLTIDLDHTSLVLIEPAADVFTYARRWPPSTSWYRRFWQWLGF